jgi:hypothetical protein
MTYQTGHVKRDPETGAIGIRTIWPEDDPLIADKAWACTTVNRGPFFAATVTVESWDDIYTPPEPSAAP